MTFAEEPYLTKTERIPRQVSTCLMVLFFVALVIGALAACIIYEIVVEVLLQGKC